MAPSASLQSRINAFESMRNQPSASPPRNTSRFNPPGSHNILEEPISPEADSVLPIAPFTPPLPSLSRSPSPPNLGRKSSLIDLGDWVVDDGLSELPRVNGKGNHYTNGKGISNGSHVVHGKQPPPKPHGGLGVGAPLINLESSSCTKGVKAPPLPPRNPSIASLKVGLVSANSMLTGRSDTLTVDQPHTYPPPSQLSTSDSLRKGSGHAPTSSISSFHSVSLSSDGGGMEAEHLGSHIATYPMDQQNSGGDGDSSGLDESFENVSTSSAISPSTASKIAFDWESAMSQAKQIAPPKLPQRTTSKLPSIITPPSGSSPCSTPPSPKLGARSALSSSSSSTTTTRRPPPPPPPSVLAQQFASPPPPSSRYTPRSSRASLTSASASDRSSILSTATTTSRTSISTRASTQFNSKLSRPTPVPAAARKRYEAVFVANVIQRRKAEKQAAKKKAAMLSPGIKKNRQAAGWRGLSVDLITNPDDHPVLSSKENEDQKDDDYVGPDERMDGMTIKFIWSASKLEKEKLRAIWSECDPSACGSLDRDSFVKGMWRIDEELRRAQLNRQTSRIRLPPPIKNSNPRPILR